MYLVGWALSSGTKHFASSDEEDAAKERETRRLDEPDRVVGDIGAFSGLAKWEFEAAEAAVLSVGGVGREAGAGECRWGGKRSRRGGRCMIAVPMLLLCTAPQFA